MADITVSSAIDTFMQSASQVAAAGNLGFTTTAAQTYTFPSTSATIARTDAAQTFTGAQTFGAVIGTTWNGNTWATGTGTLSIAAGKTLTSSNTLTFTGTDSSSVAFGAGGTVLYSGGSYVSSITGTASQITASASTGAVTLSLPATVGITTALGVATTSPTTWGTFAVRTGQTGVISTYAVSGSFSDGSTGTLSIAHTAGGFCAVFADGSLRLGASNAAGLTFTATTNLATFSAGIAFVGSGSNVADFTNLSKAGTSSSSASVLMASLGISGALYGNTATFAGTVIHTLSATPASAAAAGTTGTISWDSSYIYIATGTNTWKRVAIATW